MSDWLAGKKNKNQKTLLQNEFDESVTHSIRKVNELHHHHRMYRPTAAAMMIEPFKTQMKKKKKFLTFSCTSQTRAPTLSRFCRRPPSSSTPSLASTASPSRWSCTPKTWPAAQAATTPVTDGSGGLDWTGTQRSRTGPQALCFSLRELDFWRAALHTWVVQRKFFFPICAIGLDFRQTKQHVSVGAPC